MIRLQHLLALRDELLPGTEAFRRINDEMLQIWGMAHYHNVLLRFVGDSNEEDDSWSLPSFIELMCILLHLNRIGKFMHGRRKGFKQLQLRMFAQVTFCLFGKPRFPPFV